MRAEDLPKYKDLPIITQPHYRGAWGLFDPPADESSPPKKDSLGTLNLLTPEVVAAAGREIRAGISVSLNWGLEKVHEPAVGRCRFEHKIIDLGAQLGVAFHSYDDEVRLNTQSGSQWDGLRHWGHLDTGMFYNGTHHRDLLASGELGIEHINARGGIVARGVLLDYVAYAARHGIEYSPMSGHGITVADLEAMAAEAKVEFRPGDILITRTGWIKWYEEHSPEEREAKIAKGNAWVGVKGCAETVEWLWDHHFAAVAGDAIGWECWPAEDGYMLHNHLLAMWGMPMGEMWDLEALAAECEKQQRWTFFLTSAPFNVTGGVASPPNALAIF